MQGGCDEVDSKTFGYSVKVEANGAQAAQPAAGRIEFKLPPSGGKARTIDGLLHRPMRWTRRRTKSPEVDQRAHRRVVGAIRFRGDTQRAADHAGEFGRQRLPACRGRRIEPAEVGRRLPRAHLGDDAMERRLDRRAQRIRPVSAPTNLTDHVVPMVAPASRWISPRV